MSFALFNAIPSDPVSDQLLNCLDNASSIIESKSSNFELKSSNLRKTARGKKKYITTSKRKPKKR